MCDYHNSQWWREKNSSFKQTTSEISDFKNEALLESQMPICFLKFERSIGTKSKINLEKGQIFFFSPYT